MRDPIEDLQHLRSEGTTVNPLPASEVRRRGDRMRRRNTALATVGGVAAALVAVGVPLGLARSGSSPDGRDLSPAPAPTVSWLQEVPADYPLADGLQRESVVDEVATYVPDGCGTPFWTTDGTVDVAGAVVAGGEAFDARTLMLYPDEAAAVRALDGIREAVADCPEQTVADEGPDTTKVTEVLDQDLPAEESFVFVERVRFDDGLLSDATITGIGRSGNALLVDQSYGSAGDDRAVEANLRRLVQQASVPMTDLCVFSATPCGGGGTSAEPAAEVVPDGFPLLDGFPAESPGEAARTGPGRDLEPLVPQACGARAEVPRHTDLVRAGFGGHSDTRERQLVTFASEEEADAYVDAVLAVLQDCLEVPEGGLTRLTQVVTSVEGVGDRAGGAVTRRELDGEPVPGLEALLVVRVGAAVLVSTQETEDGGTDPGPDVQAAFNRVLEDAGGVVEAMGDL